MDFHELFHDILVGFIVLGRLMLVLALIGSLLIGSVSAILILFGKIVFFWWYVPFWIVLLITIAAFIGEVSKEEYNNK